ncbi:MAG: Gfo/Idh/MocA family oxidoreductase [Opitutaceae bacterium]|nr:Gfo/Idh/MocA family oxidoreductase [Opitutaceae bacterium]
MRHRVSFVGVGHRATRFIDELASSKSADLVGFCDISATRMAAHNRWLVEKHGHPAVATFGADQFEEMIRSTRSNLVVVATVDSHHDEYIVRALKLGCHVVTEKPMTTDEVKCRRILESAQRCPEGRITVAFNYRWAPTNAKVKELLDSGVVGRVKSVNLEWLLDTRHGADYFRRWHSEKLQSGGLLVHKSTHHFDLVNWWTDSIPADVFASGGLRFYGDTNAVARGEGSRTRYPRYTGQDAARGDAFAIDLSANPHFRDLYLAAEPETGYIRDRNVFRPGIDIEDDLSVIVRYRSDVMLTYTLNAFSPREGMRVVFNGDRGRLEYYQFEKSHGTKSESDEGHSPSDNGDSEGRPDTEKTFIRVYPHFGSPYSVAAQAGPGGHWGGDPLMVRHLFGGNGASDALGRVAGHEQGAASILVGAAANQSLVSGRRISLSELVSLKPGARRLSELT